jgi:16S rRNA (cytosine1402-N4)-methyltransferase
MSHLPVMLNEVLEALQPKEGEVYVDGTFGAGGYTRGFLQAAACKVIAIDRDPDAQKRAKAFEEEFGERFEFIRGCFGDVKTLLDGRQVDGFVLDLGVSSFQLDEAQRGFSFRFDGPLDMRMDNINGQSAADLVNTLPEEELANLIYKYGEERKSRWVAKRIVARRKEKLFTTTQDLADVVRSCVPKSKDGIDPATRSFQALRIAVNDELGEVERALAGAPDILKDGARLVVVSFHSLEDRIIKQTLRDQAGRSQRGSRYLPEAMDAQKQSLYNLPQGKPVLPSKEEISANPRARSAKLRQAVRHR